MQIKLRTLAYEQIGDRRSNLTLVFLHGSTMTKEGMLPFAKDFTRYNCIVFDLTAHGESRGKEPENIATFAAHVEQSVQELQKKRIIGKKIVMLGYSMGGAITCEIALRKKIPLEGMVVLSSGADLKSYTPLVDGLKQVPAEEFDAGGIFSYLFGSDTSQEVKDEIVEIFDSTKVSNEIGYGDLMASNQYNRLMECEQIEIPAFLVQGNDDQIVLPEAAVATWKAIPDSQLFMIPYKGHAAIYEEQKLVTEKIKGFLRKL